MKVIAIIQARMGSSRLPGKVMKKLGGATVLEYLISRISKSNKINKIVVATTLSEKDDVIESHAKEINVNLFRGSEENVLERYAQAAEEYKADVIVRITSDCPLADPDLIDDCVEMLIDQNLDYVSNCNHVENLLPDGFDVEVFTKKALLLAKKISITSSYKEHVTFAFFKTGLFSIGSKDYGKDYSNLRITLDYEEDYEVIKSIVDSRNSSNLSWREIIEFLTKNDHIAKINRHIIRNASWELSLNQDNNSYDQNTRDSLVANSSGLLSKRADQFSPKKWPKNYIKAKGQVVWAEGSKMYLDYSIGGIGATTLGFGFDHVDNKVIETIRNGSASSLNSALELEASQKLIDAVPWIESLRFTRSGGEATTLAVRLARAHSKKDAILFSGYHGWHDWYLAAAFEHKLGNHLLDNIPISGVPKALSKTSIPFDYGDKDAFLDKIDSSEEPIGVVILEPMRYSNPDVSFLDFVRKECDKRNIVLIFDEISCGFRFNNNAVHLETGIYPDMVVFSKSIGNGYPIACIGGKKEFMETTKDTFISSTTHTESIGFAAMIAVLDYYSKNNVSESLGKRGKVIKDILLSTAIKYELDIQIKGLDQLWSWSFNCDSDTNRALQTIHTENMLKNSILFSNRFYSTLGIDPDFYFIFEKAIDSSFKSIKNIINKNEDPSKYIEFGLNRLGIY